MAGSRDGTPVPAPVIFDGGNPADLVGAVQLLRTGRVVALPTDTGYALAASLFCPEAVERIWRIKERDERLRVPVLLGTAADLPLLASEVPPAAWKLIERYWPGPFTLVLRAAPGVPRRILGGGSTVAVRVPGGRSCLQVLQSLGEPVTGTSANISRRPGARTALEVIEQLGNRLDAVVEDDGAVVHRLASTIAEIGEAGLAIHREGAVSGEDARRHIASEVSVFPQLPGGRRPR